MRIKIRLFFILGPAYQETCNCPEPNDSIWAKTMKCPAEYRQIERDLAQFPTVNLKRLRKEAVERFGTGNHALCHYSIIDGKVSNDCHCHIPVQMWR